MYLHSHFYPWWYKSAVILQNLQVTPLSPLLHLTSLHGYEQNFIWSQQWLWVYTNNNFSASLSFWNFQVSNETLKFWLFVDYPPMIKIDPLTLTLCPLLHIVAVFFLETHSNCPIKSYQYHVILLGAHCHMSSPSNCTIKKLLVISKNW